jgi:hypothetical protein
MRNGEPATLRGAYESRTALALVFLAFLGLSLLGFAGSSSSADARSGALVFLTPVIAACLVCLVLIARSSVVIDHRAVLVRPLLGRPRQVERSRVTGVSVIDCGSSLMTAEAPALVLDDGTTVELLPLMAWTWWSSASSPRVTRAADRLRTALKQQGS